MSEEYGNEGRAWERGRSLVTREEPWNEGGAWERGRSLGMREEYGDEGGDWEQATAWVIQLRWCVTFLRSRRMTSCMLRMCEGKWESKPVTMCLFSSEFHTHCIIVIIIIIMAHTT